MVIFVQISAPFLWKTSKHLMGIDAMIATIQQKNDEMLDQELEGSRGRCMSIQAMQTLFDLRENNQLCDAIIVLDDATEIPIYWALLCACSSYFR